MATKKLKCRQCGECCKWWVYYDWPPNRGMKRRMKVSGVRAYKSKWGKKDIAIVFVPYRCPQLTADDKCKLHKRGKPKEICADFPKKQLCYPMLDGCAWANKRKNWKSLSNYKRII